MRVVVDTNVLISALVFGGLPWVVLERGLTGKFRIVTSPLLMDELEGVLDL